MKKSKLISILATFNKEEMSRFAAFVRSPYYNTDEQLVRLFCYLSGLFPDFLEDQVKKESVFAAIFPNQALNKKKLGYLMSDLVKLAEKFLGIHGLESRKLLFDIQVMKELMKRKQEKYYLSLLKELKTDFSKQQRKNSDLYYYNYLISDMEAEHFATKQVRVFDNNLQIASNALDDFYFLNKLKYSCEMLNRQAILADEFSIPFMKEVQNYLSGHKELQPLVAIYFQIYFSLMTPNAEKPFEELLKLIKNKSALLDNSELRAIYLYALNMCMRKIRQGKEKYLSVTLALYEEGINNRSLFDNNYLSHWTYNNIVKLALRLERFDWIEQFIYTYNGALQKQFQENALHHNLAELHFHKKNYDLALHHLNQVHASDINYHLGSRILLIKTFYESNAIDALLSALASFTVYLSRNKQIATPLKKSCQNFCNLMHKIIISNNEKKKEKLRLQIQTLQPVADRPWLLKTFLEKNGIRRNR